MRVLRFVLLASLLAGTVALAQPPPQKMTDLVKSNISGHPDKEFILVSIEWGEGSGLALHTHFGDEYGTVLEGAYMVKEGTKDWETIAAGQSWHIPAGVEHQTKNAAPFTKTINAFVVEKGKPLMSPVQK